MKLHNLHAVQRDAIPNARRRAKDTEAEDVARRVVSDVEARGIDAVREWAIKLGEITQNEKILLTKNELQHYLADLNKDDRELLEVTHERIYTFARAQKDSLHSMEIPILGGRAGQRILCVESAGCYAPGGNYPLPSSALMTVTTARAAGVSIVSAVSPRPSPVTLAAAALSGADYFLRIGGAQAIAALAFGVEVPACDVIVGPGGRFVAAAKRILFGVIGTEAPAGPSELLVIASEGATANRVASDLIAQAEHDKVAVPALICFEKDFMYAVDAELTTQLANLPEPNQSIARAAFKNSFVYIADSIEDAATASDYFAPEHLELQGNSARELCKLVKNAGAVFIGDSSAEVLGDYGAGPNHCLPTGGAGRFAAGLSVFNFLRAQTYLDLDAPRELALQSARLARLEGLEGHARSAETRL